MLNARPIVNIDVGDLAEKLKDDSLFGEFSFRKEKYAHTDMKDIWVRYNHIDMIGERFNDEHSSVWYPVAHKLPEAVIICAQLMALVNGERLGGVLITKLPPGCEIKPHIDKGWHAEYYQKYFVPIANEKGAVFGFEDGNIEPMPGEVWEFDNSVPHWVKNDSNSDRIAMIVCIKTFASGLNDIS